jgi:hypothetical protein
MERHHHCGAMCGWVEKKRHGSRDVLALPRHRLPLTGGGVLASPPHVLQTETRRPQEAPAAELARARRAREAGWGEGYDLARDAPINREDSRHRVGEGSDRGGGELEEVDSSYKSRRLQTLL